MADLAIVGRPEKQLLNVAPLRDMVLVEERQEEQSGLVLPDKLSEETRQSFVSHWVVAAGPECEDVKVGDRVLVAPGSRIALVAPGDKRFLVHECDIHGVVR